MGRRTRRRFSFAGPKQPLPRFSEYTDSLKKRESHIDASIAQPFKYTPAGRCGLNWNSLVSLYDSLWLGSVASMRHLLWNTGLKQLRVHLVDALRPHNLQGLPLRDQELLRRTVVELLHSPFLRTKSSQDILSLQVSSPRFIYSLLLSSIMLMAARQHLPYNISLLVDLGLVFCSITSIDQHSKQTGMQRRPLSRYLLLKETVYTFNVDPSRRNIQSAQTTSQSVFSAWNLGNPGNPRLIADGTWAAGELYRQFD